MGHVDLHCHLLWNLDDGCVSPGETEATARALVEAGFSDAVASPHAQLRYASGDPARTAARLEEARALLAAAGVPLALHAGAESPLDDAYVSRARAGEVRGLGRSGRYALVELPFLDPAPSAAAWVRGLLGAGVVPVVAHPERCLAFQDAPGLAAELVALGAALQLNLGSLTGRHGRAARRVAEQLLDAGLFAVAGSDLHGPEGAARWLGEALEALEARAGAAALRRLCDDNPRRALRGEPLT